MEVLSPQINRVEKKLFISFSTKYRRWDFHKNHSRNTRVKYLQVEVPDSLEEFSCLPQVHHFNPTTTNVPHHIETKNWFALQDNWLVSIWRGTLVVNGLSSNGRGKNWDGSLGFLHSVYSYSFICLAASWNQTSFWLWWHLCGP